MAKGGAKVDAQWFQDRLRDKGLSQRGFAKLTRMDPAALTYSIHGKRKWKHDELVAFSTITGVPFEEAIVRAGLQIPSAGTKGMCTVIGHVNAEGELRLGAAEAPRRVPCPPESPEGTVAARYRTPMSAAELMDGWLVYFVDGIKRVPPEAVGRLCVATIPGRTVLGIVRKGYARGSYSLQPWMPGAALLEDVTVDRASPVLWVRTSA